jgi:hypothetical protein
MDYLGHTSLTRIQVTRGKGCKLRERTWQARVGGAPAMSTRRFFLSCALSTAGLLAATSQGVTRPSAGATPTPNPVASSPTPPTALAKELAASLQRSLPKAKLSDAMTDKIASAIQDGFVVNKAFANVGNKNLPPPDFVFSADPQHRP